MKKLKLITHIVIMILLWIIIFGAGCDKEEVNKNNSCSEYEIVDSLKNANGVVLYDSINQQYFISFYIKGTIDGMITAYPCVLNEKFKTINLKVIVSGDLFTSDNLPKPIIGGQEVFFIKIKQINLTEN